WVRLPDISLADRRLLYREAEGVCGSYDAMRKVCGDIAVAGFLPVSVFRDKQIDIDLPNKKLYLRPSGSPLPENAHKLARGERRNDARPYTVININGHSIPALLDTGGYKLELPADFLENANLELQHSRATLASNGLNGGIFKARIGTLDQDLQINDLTIRNPQVTVVQTRSAHG